MIIYKNEKNIDKQDLEKLFLSVSWESGYYPENLTVAIKNFDTVISAWDENKLVGLICALSDKIMNTFIPYFLILPEYQHKHIGETMLKKILNEYKDCFKKILICNETNTHFYKKYGFEVMVEQYPMIISRFSISES